MLKVFVDQHLQPVFEEITIQFRKKVFFGFDGTDGIPQEAWDMVVLSDRFFDGSLELEKTKVSFPFAQIFFLPISKASPSIHDSKVFIYENHHTLVNNCVSLIQWISQSMEYRQFYQQAHFSDHPFFHGPSMHAFLHSLKHREWSPYPVLLVSEPGIDRFIYAQYLIPDCVIKPLRMGLIPRNQLHLTLFGDSFSPGVFSKPLQGLFLDDMHVLNREDLSLLYTLLTNRNKPIGAYQISGHYPVLLGAEKATNDDESDLRFLSGMVDVIDIPSIRQRKEDIPYILNKLVNDLSQKLNKHISLPEESLWQMVKEFPWSGNEQELLDFAHKIIMNGPIEAIQQLIDQMEGVQYANQIPKLNPFLCQLRENVERILVEKAMITTDKNRKKAASILGISYKSLCKKIKEVE